MKPVKMYIMVDYVSDEAAIKKAIEEIPDTTVEILERIHSKRRLLVTVTDLRSERQSTIVQAVRSIPHVIGTESYSVKE